MFGRKRSSEDDHLNAESLVQRAIPQNKEEKQAAADHLAIEITTGQDPIPRVAPNWTKDFPSPK